MRTVIATWAWVTLLFIIYTLVGWGISQWIEALGRHS